MRACTKKGERQIQIQMGVDYEQFPHNGLPAPAFVAFSLASKYVYWQQYKLKYPLFVRFVCSLNAGTGNGT